MRETPVVSQSLHPPPLGRAEQEGAGGCKREQDGEQPDRYVKGGRRKTIKHGWIRIVEQRMTRRRTGRAMTSRQVGKKDMTQCRIVQGGREKLWQRDDIVMVIVGRRQGALKLCKFGAEGQQARRLRDAGDRR
eukprot:764425-Hanusia_phi.AAC.1